MAVYVSDLLTATAASVSGKPTPTRTWQWLRDGTAISGANSSTYTVVADDLAASLSVKQTETNIAGTDTATSATVGPVDWSPFFLFQSSQDGAWYEAFDLDTLFQESTGETPVTAAGQPVGLMLDKSQGQPDYVAPELVTNGTFDDASDWTTTGGWSISGGEAVFTTGTSGGSLIQTVSVTNGQSYIVTFTKTAGGSGASFRLGDSGTVLFNLPTGAGTFTYYVTATSGTTLRFFSLSTGSSFTLDNISVRELAGNHASQATSSARPTYQTSDDRLTMDKVDDRLVATLPAITGTMVLSTPEGTAAYGVNISAGSYDIGGRGGDYFPGSALVGQVIRDGAMTQNEIDQTIAYFRANGGGTDYGSVTDFSSFWSNWSELTEFPLIDTSNGTNFGGAWSGCSSLTSFPLIDTSSGTNFAFAWFGCSSLTSLPLLDTSSATSFSQTWQGCSSLTSFPALDLSSATAVNGAWRDCTSLTTFPANMFDSVTATNFTNTFFNTNLSQTSIDNILVSINTANTSNGTFDQTGGSAPSATGEAAIDALRGRGWTVTVTGGY